MKTVCKFFLTAGKILAALILLALLISSVVYINLKNFTVKKIRMSDAQNHEQEVYLMGTFHTSHFDKMANYSIEEMLNAVKNINPDVKAQWPVDTTNRFYNSQMKYCELFKSNKLYKEK